MSLRLVAIDLALRNTGLAWTSDHHGQARPGTRTVVADRLAGHARIHHVLSDIAAAVTCQPHMVGIEAMYAATGKGGTPLRLAEIHGVVTHWLYSKGVPYCYVEPQQIKIYATGNGNADKTQMQAAVTAEYGHLVHIGDEHQADATALLALMADAYAAPLTPVLNPRRRRAVETVRWPTLGGES